MNKIEILDKLLEIFKLVVGKTKQDIKITCSTKIEQDLGLTSVALVYMIFAIEKSFNITLNNIKKDTFITVGDVVDLIYSKLH